MNCKIKIVLFSDYARGNVSCIKSKEVQTLCARTNRQIALSLTGKCDSVLNIFIERLERCVIIFPLKDMNSVF